MHTHLIFKYRYCLIYYSTQQGVHLKVFIVLKYFKINTKYYQNQGNKKQKKIFYQHYFLEVIIIINP